MNPLIFLNNKFLKILLAASVLLFFVFTVLFHQLSHEDNCARQECPVCHIIVNYSIQHSNAAAVPAVISIVFIKFIERRISKSAANRFNNLPRAPPFLNN